MACPDSLMCKRTSAFEGINGERPLGPQASVQACVEAATSQNCDIANFGWNENQKLDCWCQFGDVTTVEEDTSDWCSCNV